MNVVPFLVLGLVTLVQLALMVWAIIDLVRRQAVTWNNKWVWVAIIVVFGLIGPIVYFVAGRPPQPMNEYGDGTARRQIDADKRISAVTELLYGPADDGKRGAGDAQRGAGDKRGAGDAQREAGGKRGAGDDSNDAERAHPSGDQNT